MKDKKILIIVGILLLVIVAVLIGMLKKFNDKEEGMNKDIEEIKGKAIIEVSESYGGDYNPYSSGIIVTNDKEIYKYLMPLDSKENVNFIKENRTLSDEEFNEVTKFIENEIINKKYEDEMIMDAGFNVTINYNGVKKKIKNNKGDEQNPKLYDNAKAMLDKLLK